MHFNPRSHERSDSNTSSFTMFTLISIHAPTRGATCRCEYQTTHYQYFNPRSHERSDNLSAVIILTDSHFNPRSHERSDDKIRMTKYRIKISIHAPTRGATTRTFSKIATNMISIHAPTRGATELPRLGGSNSQFQSTLPREERQQYCTKNLFIFIQYRQ